MPSVQVAPGTGGMDQQELVATDEDLAHLDRALAGQALDEDIDELVFVMLVEHVGQAVGAELHDPRQDAVLSVGDELDLLARPRGFTRRRGRGPGRWDGTAEHDAKAATDALDHAGIVGPPAHLA